MTGGKAANFVLTLGARARQVAHVIRLRPFDTSSPEGRSQERHRRLALSAGASAMARALGLLVTLITVPLTLEHLGQERYGLWMTITSVVAIFGFADLGIGSGLVNALAEAHGRNDQNAAQKYVSSAFFLLLGVALVLIALALVAYPWVPWRRIFNVRSATAIAEAGPATTTLIICFAAGIPMGIAQRIHAAFQEGFAGALWHMLGTVFSLALLLLAIHRGAGLPMLVLAVAGGPVVAAMLNLGVVFFRRQPSLRPSFSSLDPAGARRVLQTGALFFVLQLAVAIGYQSDSIVIAQVIGAEAVTEYGVPYRLFIMIPVLLSFILTPLWPAYGEALARKDVGWVRQTLRRSIVLSLLLAAIPSMALVAFGKPIIAAWVGEEVRVSLSLLIAFALWAMSSALGGPLAMFLNGTNVIGFQVVCASSMAACNILLSIVLARHIGVAGVVYATVIAQALFILLPSAFYVPRLLNRLSASTANPPTASPPALAVP